MNKKQSLYYIAGLFDGEGCIDKKRIIITNTKKELLNICFHFLKKLKINNKIYKRKQYKNCKITYDLKIYGRKNIEKFYKFIPINHTEKLQKLQQMLSDYIVPKITSSIGKLLIKLRKTKLSYAKIANKTNLSKNMVWRYLQNINFNCSTT